MFQVLSVSKSYGTKQLFRNVSFSVNAGECLAVYGANGVGKSTLLRILSGEEEADSGSIILSPPSVTIGYLPQGYSDASNLTVGDLLSGQRFQEVEAELAELADQLSREASPDERGGAMRAGRVRSPDRTRKPSGHDDLATRYERPRTGELSTGHGRGTGAGN
jgi:ATPase subunit of ABC transporter with duplicated ATPase domains